VVDEWQGRGLGMLLLEVISARALDEGVGTFTALMLARNQAMMDLFERLGPVRVVGRAAGTVEIEVAIPAVEVAPESGSCSGGRRARGLEVAWSQVQASGGILGSRCRDNRRRSAGAPVFPRRGRAGTFAAP
jgi:hypothetical protein